MTEPFLCKTKRLWREFRIRIVKERIKRNVRKYDLLHDGAFMALSWGVDEVTDYHVIAERNYPDRHIYGTEETLYW